ncbi:hypothetical protein ACIA8J_13965, partial [Streptomyces asoensis]
MRPILAGRLLRLGSAAVACLLTAGTAGPASAADDLPQTDELSVHTPYSRTLPLGTGDGRPPVRTLGVGLYHDNDNFTVTDGRLTVDVSGLAGVAEVTWPENCTPNGASAVCDVPLVPAIGGFEDQVLLTVRAADGAGAGAQGRITYEATATGGPEGTLTAPHDSFSTTLTIGSGPDLAIDPLADIKDARPGDERTIPFKITNNGDRSANGFTVSLSTSHGLADLTRYDACTYTAAEVNDYPPTEKALCTFDRVLAPGDSFELPEPLTVRLAPHALAEGVGKGVGKRGARPDTDPPQPHMAPTIGARANP